MVSRTATERAPSPEAIEFVRFCYRRRRVGWPELYDEMCAVAGRGLFRGWGSDELGAQGIGFSLFELPALAALVERVVSEDPGRRERVTAAELRIAHADAVASHAATADAPGPQPVMEAPAESGTAAEVRFVRAAAPVGA
jgi:hypothetical protein